MVVTVGSLRVDMTLDSAQFQAGAVRAQRQLGGLQSATTQLQRSANSFNFRGLNQQLSQVAQQVAATGRPLQAFAVQAADIGLAFGPWGVVIGAVAGLVLPSLVTALGGGEAAIDAFNESAKATKEAMSGLNSTISGISSLQRDYKEAIEEGNGALAEQIRLLILLRQAEAEYQALQIPRLIREQEDALRELTRAQRDQWDEVQEAARAAQDALNGGDASQIAVALSVLEEVRAEYDLIAEEAGLAANRTEQLKLEALIAENALRDAATATVDLVEGAGTTAAELVGAAIEAGRLKVALGSINMSGIVAQAQGLAVWLASAAQQALTLNANMGAGGPMGGARPSDTGRASGSGNPNVWNGPTPPVRPFELGIPEISGGATGGGSSPADTVDELREAFDRLMGSLDPVIGAQQDLAEGTKIADDALAAGVISAEQHAAAVAALAREYADATDQGDVWTDTLKTGVEDLGDAFGDFMASGMRDFDSFADALVDTFSQAVSKMVAEAAAAQLGQALGSFAGPVGGFIGSIVGGLFGGLFGGGGGSSYEGSEQQRIDQERAALVREMHVLMGHEDYLKRQEIANLDESNRELGKRVQQLEEEAIAAAEAAAAAQRIADERMALQVQLWQMEGDEAALRDYQLSQLDESNRALQEQIWAQQDLAEATAETTRAIEEAVAAISPSDYSTQFAYDQAIALARNGYLPTSDASIAEVNAAASQSSSDSASLAKQISTLTQYMKQMLDLQYDWDTNGLLTVTA